jgi:hypothetical protein
MDQRQRVNNIAKHGVANALRIISTDGPAPYFMHREIAQVSGHIQPTALSPN